MCTISEQIPGYAYTIFLRSEAFKPSRITMAKMLIASSALGPRMWAPRIRSFSSSIITFDAANSSPVRRVEYQPLRSLKTTLCSLLSMGAVIPTEAIVGIVKTALGTPV